MLFRSPEIAQFYVDEVIDPSNAMMGRMVQRGIDSGEFRPVDVRNVVGVMCGNDRSLNPRYYSTAELWAISGKG